MQSIKLFFLRVFSGNPVIGKPSMMTRPQAFRQATNPWGSTLEAPDTYTSEINAKDIDPTNKDTWSRGQDLLWLHNTQVKQRKMLKAKFEQNFPALGTYTPYIDLPEGQVHLARYFP